LQTTAVMNKKKFNFRPSYALLALAAMALSSCNRGVGCPTNFSLETTDLVDVAVVVLNVIF